MIFIILVFSIPVYGFFIWGLKEPEEAILFIDKWLYKEGDAFSNEQLHLFKLKNWFGIVTWSFIVLMVLFGWTD